MVFQLTIKILDREILVGAPSSQWWTQLSSTIAGGLTFATILTLVATPAMLVIGGALLRGQTGVSWSDQTGPVIMVKKAGASPRLAANGRLGTGCDGQQTPVMFV